MTALITVVFAMILGIRIGSPLGPSTTCRWLDSARIRSTPRRHLHTIVGGPRLRTPRPPSRLLAPGDPRLLFVNLGTSPSPRTPLTAEEKAEICDDLLERSDRAGGTIHPWGQEPLMSEMRLAESWLSNYTEDQLIMCNMGGWDCAFYYSHTPFADPALRESGCLLLIII